MKSKKAYYYSIDALIAIMIIFSVLLSVKYLEKQKPPETQVQDDLIEILSSLKTQELDNAYMQQLLLEGKASYNKSVLEQITEFYAKSLPEANLLASEIFSELNSSENLGIWFNNELIASTNSSSFEDAEEISVARQLVSGIEQGDNVRGYSARAFLQNLEKVDYFYFGGYVGEGNISANISYHGELNDLYFEIATNKDFDIYINNLYSGHYEKSPSEFTPAKYSITSYLDRFHSGSNVLKIVADELYIAGGYVKLVYKETSASTPYLYNFPGIEGAINLYDGFYVPGNLSSMEINLHLNSSYLVFLKIGDKIIFNSSEDGYINIPNSYLSSNLNYSALSRKTIPIRLGLENVSFVKNIKINADVFSVTDLSGSMCTCSDSGRNNVCLYDETQCGHASSCKKGVCTGGIIEARLANKNFVDIVLNSSGNRLGLAGFANTAPNSYFHQLSNNSASLKSEIDSWLAVGSTCTCCGINKAVSNLLTNSSSGSFRSVVVMSDGMANVRCYQQGTPTASQDAIKAACDAYNNYNITTYAIGFGPSADESTLQAIANCGHGNYYYSNISQISSIYEIIAQDIFEAAYHEQTINITGQFNKTTLYPDSHIKFSFTEEENPYGLVITSESDNLDTSSQGSFYVPEDSSILSAEVISYSGPRWTSNVYCNNSLIYNLSEYGSSYNSLGDPYVIKIPISKVSLGINNVSLKTGLSASNSSGGSSSNKVIYRVIKPLNTYSNILPIALGCNWTIALENGQNITLLVPSNYTLGSKCYFMPDNVAFNPNDAINSAVYALLKSLDFNNNNKIDSLIDEENLKISSSEISGIPYAYHSEVQVRTWR